MARTERGLANDPEQADRLKDMHGKPKARMKSQDDEGFATEAKERQGKK
ncbi:MAG: hypothetical protein AAGI37_19595 [Planctomycetota bacterium]